MPITRTFRRENPHLFCEDSDYSDAESEDENEPEIAEDLVATNGQLDLKFEPFLAENPQLVGRPKKHPKSRQKIDIIPQEAYNFEYVSEGKEKRKNVFLHPLKKLEGRVNFVRQKSDVETFALFVENLYVKIIPEKHLHV